MPTVSPGGSNIPALNALLVPLGVQLGGGAYMGKWSMGGSPILFDRYHCEPLVGAPWSGLIHGHACLQGKQHPGCTP